MALVGDGVLAVAEGVPELDGPVAGTGDDLAVVGGEGDGEDVVGVADEAAGGHTGGELPQTEGLIPGRGEGIGAIGRDNLHAIVSSAARGLPRCPICFESLGFNVRSPKRCGSGRGGFAWGNHRTSRRGSGSK